MSEGPILNEDRIISIVKLDDGHFGVQNERNVSDLTDGDLDQIAQALIVWFDIRKRLR